MAIYATSSRYDAILMHRQKQAAAAEQRDNRAQSRQQAVQTAKAKSDTLRNTVSNVVAQTSVSQSQLMAQIIRSRMATEATEKAAPAKWYR